MKKNSRSRSSAKRNTTVEPRTLDEIANDLWDADAILSALAIALRGVMVGDKPFERSAEEVLVNVAQHLCGAADNLGCSAFRRVEDLDEKWRKGIVEDAARVEGAVLMLGVLSAGLDGSVGVMLNDARRDPCRVIRRSLLIVAPALRDLRVLRDGITNKGWYAESAVH